MTLIVPPGGFAGFSQMTPASQRSLFRAPGSRGGGKRRRKRKASRARARSGGRKRKSTRKLKFGSPAWRKKYLKR